MEKGLYSLCFIGKDNSGYEKVYEILSMQVDKIDMYTSMYSDAESFYQALPSLKTHKIPCQDYIKEEFGINDDNKVKNNDFFICKKDDYEKVKKDDQLSELKKIPVLYRNDRDVVYLNRLLSKEKEALPASIRDSYDEIFNCMESFIMTIRTYNSSFLLTSENVVSKIKRIFFEKVIKNIKERGNNTLLSTMEKNKVAFESDRIYEGSLATNENNVLLVARESKKDIILRRNMALLIKNTTKMIDDIIGKKTYLVPKYKLDERQKNNAELGFDMNQVIKSIRKHLPIESMAILTTTDEFIEATRKQKSGIDYEALDEFYTYNDLDDIRNDSLKDNDGFKR